MAAYQATTSATNLLAGDNAYREDVLIENLGPSQIWFDLGTDAAAATGIRVLPGECKWFRRAPGVRVSVICPGGLQVSPNDTRVVRS